MEGKAIKDSETAETKKDESNQKEQINIGIAGDKHTQQDAILAELSSSDSEHNPESSSNSPTHSSSSLTKSVDNDEPLADDPGIHHPREDLSCSGESIAAEVALKGPKPVSSSRITKSATEEQLQEVKPSMVMLTEEARAEVKILQKAGCQATLTTTQETVITMKHRKTDAGMQDGELELELKPEE